LIVPFAADHVTDVSVMVPFTVAAKVTLPPVLTDVDAGVIEIEVTIGKLMVIFAEADFVLSALLVAVTVVVRAEAPAVNSPAGEIAPFEADQVTDLSVTVPCTVAENCCVASARRFTVAGEIVTEVTVGAFTVTTAEADFVVSATLVAVTVTLPPVAGAVSKPPAVIVPPEADHVMALFETVPVTLAVNCCVAPVEIEAVVGEIVIELTVGAVTVTVAVAVLVGSAKLVTVMVAVPAVEPAVKTPAELIVPELADHAMDLFVTVP
jgi:hypothetical protein